MTGEQDPLRHFHARRANRGRDFVCVVTDPFGHGGETMFAYAFADEFDGPNFVRETDDYGLERRNVVTDVAKLGEAYHRVEPRRSIVIDDPALFERPFEASQSVSEALRDVRTAPEERGANVVIIAPHVGVLRDVALDVTDAWAKIDTATDHQRRAAVYAPRWNGADRYDADALGFTTLDWNDVSPGVDQLCEAAAERKRARIRGE